MLDVVGHLFPEPLDALLVFSKKRVFLELLFNLFVLLAVLKFVQLSLVSQLFLDKLRIDHHLFSILTP